MPLSSPRNMKKFRLLSSLVVVVVSYMIGAYARYILSFFVGVPVAPVIDPFASREWIHALNTIKLSCPVITVAALGAIWWHPMTKEEMKDE